MVSGSWLKKYGWIFIVILLIVGGTVYQMITGGSGFSYATDAEKIGIVTGEDYLFIWYNEMDSINLIDMPELGTPVEVEEGSGTVYGTYKNEKYGAYQVYLYTKVNKCLEIEYDGMFLLINNSSEKKTQQLYDGILEKKAQENN